MSQGPKDCPAAWGDFREWVSQKMGAARGISEITSVVVEGEEEPVQSVARRTVLQKARNCVFKRCHPSCGHICVQKFRLHIE